MKKLIIYAFAGFVAQMIDGSLGMGFGASSSSILLTFGVAPAIVSATVHFSQIATTAASGISHLKFKNVHRPTLYKLTIPGAVGAFIGGAILTHINGDLIKPFIAVFLLMMGLYILYQFLIERHRISDERVSQSRQSHFIVPQGMFAGLVDAIGGGGWGPINTSIMLSRKRLEPRYAIGTVSASEFLVTLSASVSFIIFLGIHQINWMTVIALAIGGAIAAPIAACLVKWLSVDILAVCVGGLIIFTNINALITYFLTDNHIATLIRLVIIGLWGILVIYVVIKNKRNSSINQKKSIVQGGIE
ncbi:sulfite exporter TauE/SafE family protein [Staphylococcus felis]|uniref:sulfite exporter TauE/SafE family protein n=1 Tax=Staphylococcus felis TaxID=46127 RepID=UPI000E2342F7|nr:sulfite exporter TauE/SafE family protein [Staphylococcus felis]REI06518.1 sulfite exporter TauE/SafE family protein [Staphylococcus felis]